MRRATVVAAMASVLAAAGCGGLGLGGDGGGASPTWPIMGVACSDAVLVPWFKSFIDGTAPDLVIERVDVVACRNGYAHVWAIPRKNPEGMSQYDSEQFWLRFEDGAWRGVAQGTGITCSDPDRTPEHAAACDALGES